MHSGQCHEQRGWNMQACRLSAFDWHLPNSAEPLAKTGSSRIEPTKKMSSRRTTRSIGDAVPPCSPPPATLSYSALLSVSRSSANGNDRTASSPQSWLKQSLEPSSAASGGIGVGFRAARTTPSSRATRARVRSHAARGGMPARATSGRCSTRCLYGLPKSIARWIIGPHCAMRDAARRYREAAQWVHCRPPRSAKQLGQPAALSRPKGGTSHSTEDELKSVGLAHAASLPSGSGWRLMIESTGRRTRMAWARASSDGAASSAWW
mmetsp:Transcript_4520/g.13304  ORF Transcript_4520/g.13304 Transcript_4520/m.13304 type:complete len:265 (-) Transcript_4520:310-1104(-)